MIETSPHPVPKETATKLEKLDAFTRAYAEALFSTECGPDSEELTECNFEDLAPETLERILTDCAAFRYAATAETLSEWGEERAGHDFWLSRNGVLGFWRRGRAPHETERYSNSGNFEARNFEADRARLEDLAYGMGYVDIYLGDDGKIYFIEADIVPDFVLEREAAELKRKAAEYQSWYKGQRQLTRQRRDDLIVSIFTCTLWAICIAPIFLLPLFDLLRNWN